MAKRRQANVFSLSFLDVMSCGFGAVILIYIVINHAAEATSQEVNAQLLAEITRIEEMINDESKQMVVLRNSVTEQSNEIVNSQDMATRLIEMIQRLEQEVAIIESTGANQEQTIESLKSELKELEAEAANLERSVSADESAGSSLRSLVGQGDRQYLTGMKVGGQHILILVDSSASMLDKSIVNVIRRRNLPEDQKLQSAKWQRAIDTVEWLLANLPKEANFQVVTFNTSARTAVSGTDKVWLRAIERNDTDAAINSLRQTIPKGGTSLHHPFTFASELSPQPDNIFLIVDSLPTMGLEQPKHTVIDSRDRVELFTESIELLPFGGPVNIILFPMEGDPIAAPSYWRLAQITGGSFLSPPEDWP